MDRTRRIDELERTIAEERELASMHFARALGAEAELRWLRTGKRLESELGGLPRTEAIVEVLRQAGTPRSPSQIAEALRAAGRSDDSANKINATLTHLTRTGRVIKVGRGLYAAGA